MVTLSSFVVRAVFGGNASLTYTLNKDKEGAIQGCSKYAAKFPKIGVTRKLSLGFFVSAKHVIRKVIFFGYATMKYSRAISIPAKGGNQNGQNIVFYKSPIKRGLNSNAVVCQGS